MTMMPHLQRAHEKFNHDSTLELGTVIGVNPIQISLDLAPTMTLDFSKGDFVMDDQIILKVTDRVYVSKIRGQQLWIVCGRIRGKLGSATFGDPALVQPLAKNGDATGPATAGTAHTHLLVGTAKVKSE